MRTYTECPICAQPKQKRRIRVTQKLYQFCYVLRLIEDCKMYGLIEGGYNVNLDRIDEVLERGEKRGFCKPTNRQIGEIIHAMNADIAAKRRD